VAEGNISIEITWKIQMMAQKYFDRNHLEPPNDGTERISKKSLGKRNITSSHGFPTGIT
jgi:hypothetical protein